jgi:GNAT superfamily N-acetyltransferase
VRLRIVPLDPSLHDRAAFSCGIARIDRFLQVTAAQAARHLRSATFVLSDTNAHQQIVGFCTLAQHAYRDGELDETSARALKVYGLETIPIILLGQLAVATQFKAKGLGALLLKNALERALGVAQEAGGVALITDPYNDTVEAFYGKYGFQPLHREPFARMMLPLRSVAAAFLAR